MTMSTRCGHLLSARPVFGSAILGSALRPVFLATAALIAVSGLVGCDDTSASASVVSKANQSVQAAGTTAFSPDSLASGIGQNASNASSGVSAGTAGEKGSAALLSAQAGIAVGEKEAQAMSKADGEIRLTLARMNEFAGLWSLKSTIAATAESFDPAPQLKELAASDVAKNKELAETTKKRDEMRARLDDLRKRATGLSGEAKTFFDQASNLRQHAAQVSAREGVEFVEQAAAARRSGDAKRLEAEKLTAEADMLQPQVVEQDALINKINNQKAKIAEAKKAYEDRKAASAKEAADNREMASQMATEVDRSFEEVVKTLNGEFQSAFDNAKGQFEKALGSAKGATDAGSSAKVLAGSAGLSIAGLQATRLQLLSSIASTLDVLTKTEPALPRRENYLAKRSEITQESAALLEETKSTIEGAQANFASASVSGDAKQKLQDLAERLKALPEALEPPPADGVPRGAKKAVADMIAATKEGRFDEIPAMFHANSDTGTAVLGTQSKLGAAIKRINDASQAKFEKPFGDVIVGTPGGAQLAQMFKQNDYSNLSVEQLSFEKKGDKVLVRIPGSPMPMEVVQVDGVWKLSLGQAEGMVVQMAPMLDKMAGALEAFATKLEAGDFETADSAASGFTTTMMEAMQGGG